MEGWPKGGGGPRDDAAAIAQDSLGSISNRRLALLRRFNKIDPKAVAGVRNPPPRATAGSCDLWVANAKPHSDNIIAVSP